MPKRKDIKSIVIIGAGPIVIGQACEFDYSGVQACKALKEEGYKIILINSNPATIMTDPDMADVTYIEPITVDAVTKILEKERPDVILPTMGGQTALNISLDLANNGTLDRLGIELIGANQQAIETAEDRYLFKLEMEKLGIDTPKSKVVKTLLEAQDYLDDVGLPAIIRPSFTLAGTGGGIAYNKNEYKEIVQSGLEASPVTEVLIEESVLGWKEYEMEVVRDKADNCIIVCSIENIDPMGIHTGDSMTVAPALTLTDKEYQYMRNASLAVLRGIGVDTGGSNVQFAVNPEDGRVIVIEMNPRVSRSSALASKATGFPIAKVAAKLAVGYTLDELDNDITGGITPASFEPTIDYVVTKIPLFAFEKFKGTQKILTTSMKSVGEVMAIGRSFEESLQKALSSLETGLTGLNEIALTKEDNNDGDIHPQNILAALSVPRPDRILVIAQALRNGFSIDQIYNACKIDKWYLRKLEEIVNFEIKLIANGLPNDRYEWLDAKKLGFTDDRIAEITDNNTLDVIKARQDFGIRPVFKRVDTCAAEFNSNTPYMYSTYEGDGLNPAYCEAEPSDKRKVIILGSGPNRIGQGIEFDYCCVHASFALREVGIETVMINCNPETVSTDYDTSDRLYFEPLTTEKVIEIIHKEQENGELLGVIVQLGGQTPLKLSNDLEKLGITILGTSNDSIDLAEDRERFKALLNDLDLKQPDNGIAYNAEQAVAISEDIGFPLVIRPSYVLGGRGMEIVYNTNKLQSYINAAVGLSGDSPVLLDKYLQNCIEVDVDVLSDGEDCHIAGVLEHVEEAGIHSGDSTCTLPPYSLSDEIIEDMKLQAIKLAKGLNVIGLMNVQFIIEQSRDPSNLDSYEIYVLEVNPRASRTVPFIAKATGIPIAKLASRIMVGEKIKDLKEKGLLYDKKLDYIAVKAPIFPFARFPGVDVVLGPEMKSTGESMGIDANFNRAFMKARLGVGSTIPQDGTVFVSVKDDDKNLIIPIISNLSNMGFKIVATGGTAKHLVDAGIKAYKINKVHEGQPHIVDSMINGEIDLVLNTTTIGPKTVVDSFNLRRSALQNKIPYYTTISGAKAVVKSIEALQQSKELDVKSLQDYINAA